MRETEKNEQTIKTATAKETTQIKSGIECNTYEVSDICKQTNKWKRKTAT